MQNFNNMSDVAVANHAVSDAVAVSAAKQKQDAKRIKIISNKKILISNNVKLAVLVAVAVACVALYLLLGINFSKWKYVNYSMQIRIPKLIAMLLAAFAIGAASLVFQTIIRNRIVTPCLLGMNALYTTTHTAIVAIAGTGSILVLNDNLSFAVDLLIMCAVAMFVYGYMFKKTKHNVLYILLIGTVLASFFSSIQSTLVRVMDPNEYETLLSSLVASFENINSEIIIFSTALMAVVAVILWKDLRCLNVMALGKSQAINLGIDYDKSVRRMLLGVTVYIAVATAMVGPISFLGLIIANLSREFFKTFKHSQLILGSTLFGIIVLIGGQMLVERVFVYSVPVSVFITLFGGAYFLYLILRRKRG